MLRDDILELLRCPATGSRLTWLPAEALEELNQRIRESKVQNQAGETLTVPWQAGLVNADRSLAYPVLAHGPTLIVEQAVRLTRAGGDEP